MDPATGMMLFQAFSSLFGGATDKSGYKKVSNYDKTQKGVYDKYAQSLEGTPETQQAMNLLQQYLNPQSDVYRDFEAPYMTQFNEQTVPRLAEQFAGAGANSGALSSSGFGQAIGGAGAQLESNLAGMKAGMQRNAIGDILQQYQNKMGNYSNFLGQQPFSYMDQGPGMFSNMFTKFGGMSNPFGAPQFGGGGGGGIVQQAQRIRG